MAKFEWDSSKDVEVVKDEYMTGDKNKLVVSFNSYDGGANKLKISRMYTNDGQEWKFGKAGRLSETESLWMAETIIKWAEEGKINV